MKLSRLGVGVLVSLSILTIWLGACASGDEACGIDGIKNGTCRQGTTCPSGSVFLNISDPSDQCPLSGNASTSYICCVPGADGSASSNPGGGSAGEDAATAATPG